MASAAPPPKYLAAPDLYASGAGAGGECANLYGAELYGAGGAGGDGGAAPEVGENILEATVEWMRSGAWWKTRVVGGDGAADAGDEVGDLVVRETALAHLEVVGVRARQRTRLCLFSQMRGVGRDVKAREAMHLGQGNICISDKGISEVRKHTAMGCRDIKRWRSN